MVTIPAVKTPRFYEKKWPAELLGSIAPLVAMLVTAYVNFVDPEKKWLGWVLIGGIVFLIAGNTLKVMSAKKQDKEAKDQLGHDGLRGAAHVIYSTLSTHLEINEQDKLRVTIHRLTEPVTRGGQSEELEQVVPYVGGEGGPEGRRFSIRSGIIGKAVREKKSLAFERQNENYEDFIKELVRDWSYTEADARKLRTDRKSWMAVPILGPKNAVVGVVYLDSNDRELFNDNVQSIVIAASIGLAAYTKERYS